MTDPRAATVRPSPPRAWLVPLVAIACTAASWWFARVRFDPPAAKGIEAPESEFSAARAMRSYDTLRDFREPHPVGSLAHAHVRDAIVASLKSLGLETETQPTIATNGFDTIAAVENVVARIPGREELPALMIAAHYDSVAAGPGAGDDGSGVVTVLEIARALKSGPPLAHPVVVLLTDGEELGLIGAEAFVHEHRWAADVGLVLNFEARGTSGRSMMFETSADNGWLIRHFARAVERPAAVSAAYEVYKRMPNDTDFTVFKGAGMAGMNFAFIGGLRHYHTPLDDVAHLDPRSVQHHGDQGLALVRELGDAEWERDARGDRVYADVLGFYLLSWPAGSSAVLAALCLIGLFAVALAWKKIGILSWSACAWGVAGAVLVLAASAASGSAITALLCAIRGSREPWAAEPGAVRAAAFALATASAAAVGALALAKRAGFHGAWTGAWITIASIAFVLARMVPGASYLAIVPAIVALASALASLGWRARPSSATALWLTLPSLGALCVFWFPLIMALEQSFEWRLAFAHTGSLGFVLLGLLPCLVHAPRATSLVALACFVVAIGAVAKSVASPIHSPEFPARLDLVHVQSEDQSHSRFFALTDGAPPPEFAGRKERFEPADPSEPPHWLRAPARYATNAPTWAQMAPFLLTSGSASEGSVRRINARIVSRRSAPCLVLELADEVRVLHASWRGHECHADVLRARTLFFYGFESDGIDLTFEVASAEQVEMELYDVSGERIRQQRELRQACPTDWVQRSSGDRSVIHHRVHL